MRVMAYAAHGPGARLEPFEYELSPEVLEPGQVEIAISCCGICHTDLHLLNNDWGFTQYPMVPGHEIVGTVMRLGPGISKLQEGQRVGVGWESGSCGECEYCARGEENICLGWKGTCTHGYGGYATAIRVQGRFALPVPESLPSEKAAPLMCGGITVFAPISQEVRPTMGVGVIGMGGLGHLAVQYAWAFGCEVTAFSTSPEKEVEARRLGAHHFVDSRDAAAMEKRANRLDFIISTVAADVNWMQYLNALKPKGKMCIVGVPPNALPLPALPLILGRKSVFGSPVGSPSQIRDMLEFSARHRIEPMTETMPMAEVNQAMDRVKLNKARYRIVLTNGVQA